MATFIDTPSIVTAAGNPPKLIKEFVGRINSKTEHISIARMKSPAGWKEPGQTPGFDEYTIVLKGVLNVKTKNSLYRIGPGQAIITYKGEWVQYGTPGPEGAEYIAVCIPAFSPDTVHRDE